MAPGAAVLAPLGPVLTPDERRFFASVDPWGFILFARNVETPAQLRRLTADLREAVGRDAPVMIDQEGGRVQRMRAPHWREYLPALDQMVQAREPLRAQWLRNRLIAAELRDAGLDVNCAPLADIAEAETHPVLRNRLYGDDPETVIAAARACAEGLLAGGVLPVLKHIPGYGRASVDSHKTLPRVGADRATLERHDFAPFRALADLPIGMTAHIVFFAIDACAPATASAPVMRVIRDEIGFGGLILTDDLSMEALSGPLAARAAAALAAGCDIVLHCNGEMSQMAEVAEAAGRLTPVAKGRAEAALALRRTPEPVDIGALAQELESLLSKAPA